MANPCNKFYKFNGSDLDLSSLWCFFEKHTLVRSRLFFVEIHLVDDDIDVGWPKKNPILDVVVSL